MCTIVQTLRSSKFLSYLARNSSKEVIIITMTEADNSPTPETPESHPPNSTSAKKVESNRRNAQKSTGPRTEQGKANSRLNALKHGILASNSVIATIEGREHRAEFGAMVDGLGADLQPVGTLEQMLVEDIAASFWRKRRLLRFESRAALEDRDRRISRMMDPYREIHRQPAYSFNGHSVDLEDILDEAQLGLDLPSESDCMRVVRYEATIARTLRLALSELRTRQAARMKNREANPDAYADRDVVIDKDAMKLNAGPGHSSLGVKLSMLSRALDHERELDEQAEEDAANPKAAAARTALEGALLAKIRDGLDGTKPNSSANAGTRAAKEARATAATTASDGAASAASPTSPASK